MQSFLFPPVGFLDFLRRDIQKAIKGSRGDKAEESMRVWVPMKGEGCNLWCSACPFRVFITVFKFDENLPTRKIVGRKLKQTGGMRLSLSLGFCRSG